MNFHIKNNNYFLIYNGLVKFDIKYQLFLFFDILYQTQLCLYNKEFETLDLKVTFDCTAIKIDIHVMQGRFLWGKVNFEFTVTDRFYLIRYVVAIAADSNFEATFARLASIYQKFIQMLNEAVLNVKNLYTLWIIGFYFKWSALTKKFFVIIFSFYFLDGGGTTTRFK